LVEERFSFRDAHDIEHALYDARSRRNVFYRSPNGALPFSVRLDRRYSIGDFCCHDGVAFVTAAYQGLLERQPDAEGAAYFLALREGGARKAMILGRMRYSSEGRLRNVYVHGLRARYLFWRACQLPLIGYILESGLLLASLPRMSAAITRLEYKSEQSETDQASEQ